MNTTDYIIRLETLDEQRTVENLVRESFWNVYRPGCSEHYVLHVMRTHPDFVPELNFVMEQNGKIIGQTVFLRTFVAVDDGGQLPILTMGPICIAPEYKRKGFGKKLLDFALARASEMGFGAVMFEGNIDFYGKSGFSLAARFGIRYHDFPADEECPFFLGKELIDGYLDGVTGEYQTPEVYLVAEEDVEQFDALFPPKQKLQLPTQLF